MPEQFGEKSLEATPHRRQKARDEGQVAKSQDLASAVLLVGAVLVLMVLGSTVADFLGRLANRQLGGSPWLETDIETASFEVNVILFGLARVLLPVFSLILLLAVVAHVGQVGFHFLPKKVAMDLNRVSPLSGAKRLFSLSGLVRLAFGSFKVLVVSAVALWSVWGHHEAILSLGTLEVREIACFVFEITTWTCLKIGAALLVLALLDYGFQRWKFERDLRMTPQEMREELKTLQGDPQIVARRRAVQRQWVLNRLSSTIPTADVVVTNPTELAIAIQYEPETMAAPIVVAKGAGIVAQRIRRLALEHNIPVVEKKELARVLYKRVEIGAAVPVEQYAAVAEVLRYVYQLKGKSLPGMEHAA